MTQMAFFCISPLCVKIELFYCNSPSLCVSKGIGGTSSSQSVSAEPRLADRDGVGSLTCGLMPTGEVLDSRESVEDRPLSAAKLSAESETHIWRCNTFCCPSTEYMELGITMMPISSMYSVCDYNLYVMTVI